ncbi:hypothetical protein BC833DRAFT_591102 [Globomyces pollinis-pini]|nr:hypothetical protein BC833DRAFT_591102 [Globomyces pollinis-pini]
MENHGNLGGSELFCKLKKKFTLMAVELTKQILRLGIYNENKTHESNCNTQPRTREDFLTLLSEIPKRPTDMLLGNKTKEQGLKTVGQYPVQSRSEIIDLNRTKESTIGDMKTIIFKDVDVLEDLDTTGNGSNRTQPVAIPISADIKQTNRDDDGLKKDQIDAHISNKILENNRINNMTNEAIAIKWTKTQAHQKEVEHHSQLEKHLHGHVAKQLEQQRLLNEQISDSKPNYRKIVSKTADFNVNYKPKVILIDGFSRSLDDSRKISGTPPRDPVITQMNAKYLFLKFPPPESSSVLYHSLQGDLLRKRDKLILESQKKEVMDPILRSSKLNQGMENRMDSVADLSVFMSTKVNAIQKNIFQDIVRWYRGKPPAFWKNDEEVVHCIGCANMFSFWRRRHHCRS